MSAPAPVDYSSVVPSRLAEAHLYFSNSIGAWLDKAAELEISAKLLVDAVSGQLEIVSIRLDATEDAQAIFETLNARGEPLSAADLIKNFIFQNHAGTEAEVLWHWLRDPRAIHAIQGLRDRQAARPVQFATGDQDGGG